MAWAHIQRKKHSVLATERMSSGTVVRMPRFIWQHYGATESPGILGRSTHQSGRPLTVTLDCPLDGNHDGDKPLGIMRQKRVSRLGYIKWEE